MGGILEPQETDMTYYRYRFSFGYGLTPVIKNLMIIMGAVFLFQFVLETFGAAAYRHYFLYYFALIPSLVLSNYFIWQLGTYIFLHQDLFHIFFNLFSLWMFGGELENYWGSKKFLFYFLYCGIGAGIVTVLLSSYPLIIGASGAIWGILLAFGWLFPNRPILLIFFPTPIPAKYMVIIFGFLELYFSRMGTGGVIAYLTHLGGVIFGFFYLAYPMIRQKIRREYYKRKWSQRGPKGGDYFH
jgi:membrane associated rhomboid family serine protease